jgi:hypothetical protein
MNIFKIERTDDVDFEQNQGHVIIAADAYQARQLAAQASTTGEPRDAWYDAATVEIVGEAFAFDQPGIVLTANRGA